MNPLALHLPMRRGAGRWAFSALAIIAAHAAVITALVHWYMHTPPDEVLVPAIIVSMVPAPDTAPKVENQDVAVGPTTEESEPTPPEPAKVEEQKPVERVEEPPPVRHAEVTLPKHEPKPKPVEEPKHEAKPKLVEKPKQAPKPPAIEARAPPRAERAPQFSQAASNAYNSLVYGHLQRYKHYPSTAQGASGTVVVRFALNRSGGVVSSAITKSSGNDTLDQEALAIVRRASPFPAFPADKPGAQDAFVGPINFSH